MDPRWLFPLLAVLFIAAALWRRASSGHWRGAPLTWLWLALIFGVVAAWLNFGGQNV